MNYIDILLIAIILISIWSGTQKGFILGMTDLVCWAGGLLLTFLLYPFVLTFIQKYVPGAGVLTAPLAFLALLIGIRLLLSLLAELFLKRVPVTAHTNQVNKIAGVVPGFLSGLIYASITALFLLLIPFSEGLHRSSRESTLAALLSAKLEKVEAKLGPILDDVTGSLSKIPTEPSSDKFVKLPFSVKDPKTRKDLEAKMLQMVNEERRKIGLKDLKADPEIAEVARKHSADMFARGYFSHISPEGATPFDRIRAAKVRFMAAGENLALAQTLTLAHTGLMNSPGHRANILHKSFGRLGIGILHGGVYGIMVTQNFRN